MFSNRNGYRALGRDRDISYRFPPDDAQLFDSLAQSRRNGTVGAVNILDTAVLVMVSVRTHQIVNLVLDGRLDGPGRRLRNGIQALDGMASLTRDCAGRRWSRTRLWLIGVDQPRLDVIPRRWIRVFRQKAFHTRNADGWRPGGVRGIRIQAAAGRGAGTLRRRDRPPSGRHFRLRRIVGTADGCLQLRIDQIGRSFAARRKRFGFDSATRRHFVGRSVPLTPHAVGQQRIVSAQALGTADLQLRFAVRLEQSVTKASAGALADGQSSALGDGILFDQNSHSVIVEDPAVARSGARSRSTSVVMRLVLMLPAAVTTGCGGAGLNPGGFDDQ